MQTFDVVVVGGGPAGAVTARAAAAAGSSVLLLEQRAPSELPSACAGLVSPRTLAVLGASEKSVLRRVRRVTFHAPGGGTLSVDATSDRAVVVDRPALEAELLSRARDAGVTLQQATRATSWQDGVVGVESPGERSAVRCRVLVGADGPQSQVAAWAGLKVAAPGLPAAQAEIAVSEEPLDRVHVFVGQSVAPGFFAWAIPAEEDRVRVGLAVSPGLDPLPYLEALLERAFAGSRVLSRRDGVIPYPPGGPMVAGRILLVGDAAAQVKPLSGGGLYFGGLCARAAGRAAHAAASGDLRELQRYEDACRRLLGAETRFGVAARSIRESLRDEDWDAVLDVLGDPDLLRLAADRVDLDHLRFLLSHIAGQPRAWRAVVRVASLLHDRVRDRVGVAVSGRPFL